MSSLIDRATALFRAFHGYLPSKRGDLVEIAEPATTALYIGKLHAVMYETEEHAQPYFHRFDEPRPLLYVSADGRQVHIVKGRYEFTDRGFIG